MPTAEGPIAQVRHQFWRTRVLAGRELRPWAAGAAALWGLGLAACHGLWPEARLLLASLCQGLRLARVAQIIAEGALRDPRLAFRPEAEHLLASILYGRKSSAEAVPHYEAALACPDHPRRDMSMVGLGLALGEAGDHEQALRWFGEARKTGPPQHEAFVTYLTGAALCRAGRFKESEAPLRSALAQMGGMRRVSVLLWLGYALARRHQHGDAASFLRQALSLARGSSRHEARVGLADVLASSGHAAEARRLLARSARRLRSSRRARALNTLGNVCLTLGETRAAIRAHQAAGRTPGATQRCIAWRNCGLDYQKLGKHAEALRCYRRAMEDPQWREFGDLRVDIGNVYVHTGDYAAAIHWFGESVADATTVPAWRVHPLLVYCYQMTGDYEAALGHATLARDLAPDEGRIRLGVKVADALRWTERYAEAADLYTRTLASPEYPDHSRLHYYLALCLEELGYGDEALEHLLQSVEGSPPSRAASTWFHISGEWLRLYGEHETRRRLEEALGVATSELAGGVCVALARLADDTGDLESELSWREEAIRRGVPGLERVLWDGLGSALREAGRYLEAENAFRRSLAEPGPKPSDGDLAWSIGDVLGRCLDRPRAAVPWYAKAVADVGIGREPEAWQGYARALLGARRYREALETAQRAAELTPEGKDAAWVYDVVGVAQFALGDRDAAIESIRRYRDSEGCSDPDWAGLWLGWALGKLKRHTEAVVVLEQVAACAASAADRADALSDLSDALWYSGRRDEALARLDEALALCRTAGLRVSASALAVDRWLTVHIWRHFGR